MVLLVGSHVRGTGALRSKVQGKVRQNKNLAATKNLGCGVVFFVEQIMFGFEPGFPASDQVPQ